MNDPNSDSQSISSLMNEIENSRQQINRDKIKAAKLEARINSQKRKDRTHRFCEIGGAIESPKVLNRELEEEDIPAIISFLCDKESKKELSNWIENYKKRNSK